MLARALLYLGLVLLLGGVFARRRLTPAHPGGRVLAGGLALLGLGVGLSVWSTLSALGFTAPADALEYLTQTTSGWALVVVLIGAALMLSAELTASSAAVLLVAAGITLWGLAGAGHGSAHGPGVRLLHAVHAGAMTVWLGGVLALATLPSADARHAARFTPIATACVLTLGFTGMVATLEHAGRLWGVWDSGYGRVLMVKLALVALALVSALLTRRAFARAAPVRRVLALEVALLIAVLGATATLAGTPPPAEGQMPMEMDGH
ncbi:hypothetical protein CVO96_18200 [Deinococcus koreensis]|uniref:Copper resistance protein D domain-containing protein n=2 Tax=Deinococcus koreensis TaxID=2054903 RepID=A0A2K3UTT6_9DEIO|nr:hypothetical protein CVO96_18200 [Deinococcus koreensis]